MEELAAPAETSADASTETNSTRTKKSKNGEKDEEKETELNPIEDRAIEAMDTIFREAKDAQTKLEQQRVSLKTAWQNAKTAVGVGTAAPMTSAFESLQETIWGWRWKAPRPSSRPGMPSPRMCRPASTR
ncbi:MAG: hypothetical protein FJ090_02785 [Deltaproteobacteria bacterium]|nr:hypothetical protein [Deltaproteobacteria bacterium]